MAILAVIGFASAVGFSSLANTNLTTLYEAVIPVRFDPDEGETVEDLADEVEDARGLAVLAGEDLLAEFPDSRIFADTASGRLFFLASGDTTDQALERASALTQAYFETDPLIGGNVNEQLVAYEIEAADFEAQIEALQRPPTAADVALAAKHDLLDQQIAAVQGRIVALTGADAGATAEERQSNANERAELETTLSSLITEKNGLDPRPSEELSAADRLRIGAFTRRLDILKLDYERLTLLSLGVSSTGRLEPVVFSDLSAEAASPVTNGIVGFFGGLGLAIFAVSFVTRARKEFWLAEDLPVPLLGEVPSRKASTAPGPPWYDSVQGGRRKESIQAVRTALDGATDDDSVALAMLGDKVGSVGLHALAVDLAASFANAGTSVLIIDADYAEPTNITEYNVGEPTLGSVLGVSGGSRESIRKNVGGLLGQAVHIRADLALMPAGPMPVSPADAVAGREFRIFLEEARERFDLVIVVAGESGSPLGRVLAQRLGSAVLVVTPGQSTTTAIDSLVADLTQQRVRVVGAISIHGRDSRVKQAVRLPSLSLLKREVAPTSSSEPTDRLRLYPFPGSRRSGVLERGSMRDLADRLEEAELLGEPGGSDDDVRDPLGTQVLGAVRGSDRNRSREPVADYVVARVEDIMTAVPGQGDLSERAVNDALDYGFTPLRSVKGHISIGEQLVMEMGAELGREQGETLASEFARILRGSESNTAQALNDWIAAEFFSRHIQRTNREPEVWHLTSEEGLIQVLVNGRGLDRDRIGQIIVEVVRRTLDTQERELKQARESGDDVRAGDIEARLRELHLFEISLGLLQIGSSDDARIIYPWRKSDSQPRGWNPIWTEGIQANIAPLQRLGLLAAPVLTEDELAGQLTG